MIKDKIFLDIKTLIIFNGYIIIKKKKNKIYILNKKGKERRSK